MCLEITNGKVALVEVVEALGEKLTSPEIQTRVVGMGLLAYVFDSLKSDFLSEKELTFIVEFLCDRLKDQHMVIPKVILCIQPIVSFFFFARSLGQLHLFHCTKFRQQNHTRLNSHRV